MAPLGIMYPEISSSSSVRRATAHTHQRPLILLTHREGAKEGRTERRNGRPAVELEDERADVGQGGAVREGGEARAAEDALELGLGALLDGGEEAHGEEEAERGGGEGEHPACVRW